MTEKKCARSRIKFSLFLFYVKINFKYAQLTGSHECSQYTKFRLITENSLPCIYKFITNTFKILDSVKNRA